MSFKVFFGIILRNWLLLTVLPLAMAVAIYFFTRKQDKEYAADTVIYTGINSSFNLKDENRNDYYSSSKAFSNLLTLFNSRNTKQEVAFHLLARHLSLKEFDPTVLSWHTYVRLGELIDKPTRDKLVGPSFEATVRNIANLYHSSDTNVIYKLLNSEQQGYSLKALSRLSASQIGNSDLLKVDYVSNDAPMCRQTLEILSEIFIRKHKELMEGQNESVIDYFKTATEASSKRLEEAENRLVAFQKENNLINYQEQVNYMASERQRQQQEYNDMERQYAGTVASLREIERNLEKQGSSVPNSQEILQLRNQLAALNTRISEYEIIHKDKKAALSADEALNALKRQEQSTQSLLAKKLDTYSSRSSSLQSLPHKDLLNEWLKGAVAAEKLKGQLLVMSKQNALFSEESKKVAPMGATLKKLEREKELAEKEYFNLLNGLSESKLTQQNIALTSQLKVVDPPITPMKASNKKRIILILAGAMSSFLVILTFLVGVEFLDSALKTPAQAARQTGLPVFGVIPQLNGPSVQQPALTKTADQLARKLLLKRQQQQTGPFPYLVGVLSNYGGEGKSTLIQTLALRLQHYQIYTQVLLPDSHRFHQPADYPVKHYAALKGLTPGAGIADIAGHAFPDNAVVLVEFPPLLEAIYPVSILQHLDMILFTVKAERSWEQEDKDIVERLRQVSAAPVEVLLNGLLPRYSEDLSFRFLPRLGKKKIAEPDSDSYEGEVAISI